MNDPNYKQDLWVFVQKLVAFCQYRPETAQVVFLNVDLKVMQHVYDLIVSDPSVYKAKGEHNPQTGYHDIAIAGSVPLLDGSFVRISLSIMRDYPYRPPYVVIQPDIGKSLRMVKYIIGNQIITPYIQNWNPAMNPPPSLCSLLENLSNIMAQDPPYNLGTVPIGDPLVPPKIPIVDPHRVPLPVPIPPTETQAKFIEEIKAKLKKISADHIKEIDKTLENVRKEREVIQVNAIDIEEKKKGFSRKIDDMKEVSAKLKSMSSIIEALQESRVEINETNVLNYVKPSNIYQEKWFHFESKRMAQEEGIVQVKKAFEDRVITLNEFLEATRKLSSAQFMCIYKKINIEQQQRKKG